MEDDVPVLSDGEIDGSLETVRVLHRTVVSLRTALEKSKAELHQLREQVKQQQDKDDPSPYERTIESLSIENHVLRGRYASDRQILDRLDRRDQQTDIDRQTDIDPQTGKMDGDEEENSRHDVDDESDVDDVFEDDDDVKFNGINAKKESSAKDQQNSRLSKGSEDDSEEVDDIELIFMTDDTKDDLNMAEDLVPIVDDGCGKFVKREGRSVLVETDISKCGVIDENEPPPQAPVPQQQLRRNTAPMLAPLSCKTSDVGSYKPIPHRELVDCGSARVKFNVAEHRSPVRPVLVDRRNLTSADRQESEAQTDITALPVHWRSESFLAQDRAVAMATTLPSKFQVEGSRAHQLRKQSLKHCERTQEARRVLLSDINFTSMVPELSRSADHLCGGAVSAALLPTSAALLSKYPRALAYMKNPDLPCGGWSPCDCSGRQPSWDYGPCGSSASMAVSASSELGLHGDCGGRRRHSMRPSLSSLDASSWASPPHHHQHHQHHQQHKQHHHHQQQSANRPLWASVPSSPTHTNRIDPPMSGYFLLEPPWTGERQSCLRPQETIHFRVILKSAGCEPRPYYDSLRVYTDENCSVQLTPTHGVLKSDGDPVTVTVTFSPTAPVTLSSSISVRLPTIMFGPIMIGVTGRGCTHWMMRKPAECSKKRHAHLPSGLTLRSFKPWKQPSKTVKMVSKRSKNMSSQAMLARESEWANYLKQLQVPTYLPIDGKPLYIRQRVVWRADVDKNMQKSRSAVPLSCSAYIHRTTSTAGQNSELVLHPNMRHHRLKYAARHKVKFSDRKLSGSFPGRSLPDLRGGGSVDSGADEDSTDSLIDESEAYLRRSIDSIVGDGADEPVFVKRGRRPRSYSQPDHVFTNGCGPGRKAQPFIARVPSDLKADTWVKVIANDGRLVVGRVRYVGPLPGVNDIQVGVVLAPGEGGNSSGTFAGVKYFDCDADCGLFAPFKKVVMAWSNP